MTGRHSPLPKCCRARRRELQCVSIPRRSVQLCACVLAGGISREAASRNAGVASAALHRWGAASDSRGEEALAAPSAKANYRRDCRSDVLGVRRETAYSDPHNFACSPWTCDIRLNIKWMYHWDGFVLSYNIIINTICVDMFYCMFQRESVQRRWNFPTQQELTRRVTSFTQTWLRFRCFSNVLLTDQIRSSPPDRNVEGSQNSPH